MGEIADLYHEASSYYERFGAPVSREFKRENDSLTKAIQDLSSELTDSQKVKLQSIESLFLSVSNLELERMFVYAFQCGARLIVDVIAE